MKTLSHIPEIDGLRALAVLGVFLFHIDYLNGGFLGVDVFFVISGYLITKILNKEKNLNFEIYKAFFIKRFKRLYPALIFVSIIILVISIIIIDPINLDRIGKSGLFSIFFLSNNFFWGESSYFDTSSNLKPFLHTWSLGIELTFYLVFPLVFFFILKKNFKTIFFFIIVSSSLIILYVLTKRPLFETNVLNGFFYGKYINDTLFFLFPFRFFEFLFGSYIAFYENKKKNFVIFPNLFIFGIIGILFSYYFFNEETNFLLRTIVICLLTSLIIINKKNKFNFLINNKIFQQIGLVSYSFYLIHWPLIVLLEFYFFEKLNLISKVAVFFVSIIFSYLIYRNIEKPFREPLSYKKKVYIIIAPIIFIFLLFSINFFNLSNFKVEQYKLDKFNKINFDKKNEFCENKHSLKKDVKEKICLVGNEQNADIVIMGDSNGTMWFPGFKLFAEKLNLDIVSYSRACNNFPHLNMNLSVKFVNCEEVDLTGKTLVLGAQWFNYQNTSHINRLINKYVLNISKIVENRNFKELKQIIIMGQIPNFLKNQFDLNTCFLRPKFLINIDCEEYFNSSENKNKYLSEIRDFNSKFFEKIQKNKTLNEYKIFFIDPVKNLCKENCIQFNNGKLLYMDNNHLSIEGSEYVVLENINRIENFFSSKDILNK